MLTSIVVSAIIGTTLAIEYDPQTCPEGHEEVYNRIGLVDHCFPPCKPAFTPGIFSNTCFQTCHSVCRDSGKGQPLNVGVSCYCYGSKQLIPKMSYSRHAQPPGCKNGDTLSSKRKCHSADEEAAATH